jgi:enoyl-CoA hydratase/carnithine racemase
MLVRIVKYTARKEIGMSDDCVLYGVTDGIATMTLNRPERRNALSVAAANRLRELWDQIDQDPGVRVAILTSADCGTFCAGMDLKEAAELKQRENVDILSRIRDPFCARMRELKKPVIAAMTGHFAAGGMMLTLGADIRIGLAGTQGGITEAKVGRGSPWAVPLLWMMPQPILMEMILTAGLVPIERLHQVGFVNYVEATPDAVRGRARTLAAAIRDNAPLSVTAGKASLFAGMDLGCAAGLDEAKRLHRVVYESRDAEEGPRAFAEKRAPRWLGH